MFLQLIQLTNGEQQFPVSALSVPRNDNEKPLSVVFVEKYFECHYVNHIFAS